MNSRAFTFSIMIAGLAMFMVYTYMKGEEAQLKAKYGAEATAVVAKKDIAEFELLDETKVRIKTFPKNFLAPGHFSSVKEVENLYASVSILKGEQITKPRVEYPGVRTGLSRQVSLGKRAFSLQVSEPRAVGKLIKPGDRVDILGLIDYAGGRKDLLKVKTILQDVLVLATGRNITNAIPLVGIKNAEEVKKLNLNVFQNYNTITVELDPYQAQKMILMITNVTKGIFITLRNNDDKQIVAIKGTRFFDLLGEDVAEAKQYFAEKEKERNARRQRGR